MLEKKKKIDIVVPTYNGANRLPGLLKSLEKQTYTGYDCYVIDDHSTDGTTRIIKDGFPWVKLIEQRSNRGPSLNRDVAIRAGSLPYIAIFDDDAYLEDSEWLDKALRIMEANANIGQLASMIVNGFRKDILLDCGISNEGCLFGGLFYNQPMENANGGHEISRTVLGACSAGTFLRRDAYEKAGGFDPRYFYPTEDLDLSLRIHLTGFDVIYDPSLVTFHFESQAMGKNLARKMYNYRRNCLLAIVDNYPLSFVAAILRHVLVGKILLPSVAHMAKRKKLSEIPVESKDYIRSLLFILSESFSSIRKRKNMDRVRTKSRKYLLEINDAMKRDLYSSLRELS